MADMKGNIEIIYKNKAKLQVKLPNYCVHFSGSENSYIGIARDGRENTKRFEGNLEVSIVLIDKGIWHYNFYNTNPVDKAYIEAADFIQRIVNDLNAHT